MKKNSILLKTMLLSTSRRNIRRYTHDRKKKRKVIGSYIGLALLYAMIMAYSILMCYGYGMAGLIKAAPVMCALVISALAFVFTFLKTNGYLFNFKEYDMLMALPFETRTVAACKFLYMYIQSLPWYLSIAIAMMIGYGCFARPPFYTYIIWLVLSFFLPVIPMLAAAFIGFLVAKISSGFKKTNLIQTVLTLVIIIFSFSLRYIIEAVVKDNELEDIMNQISMITGQASGIYLPAGWFANAVVRTDIVGILLLIVVSGALFAVVFYIVGNSYRQINSALKSHAAAKNYRVKTLKKQSVVNSIAFKEFKRLTSSTAYITNAAIGEILAALIGIITLIIGFDKIIAIVTQGAPVSPAMIQPAIPFFVYFFIGMVATTACSPSLEGKNYWILQSLPIEKKTIYQGKMLFNMYLTVPFMLFAVLCMCISAKVPLLNTVLYLILGVVLCAFSTAWGCVCGVRHMRTDWENEIEVIKQGAAVTIYMLPNMFIVMGLIVLMVWLGTKMDHALLTIIMILIAGLLTLLSYLRVMALAKR